MHTPYLTCSAKRALVRSPPVAYRALDFLVEHGFVHKVERLNAFVACNHPGETHFPTFMICRLCEKVAEAQYGINVGSLAEMADLAGFQIEQTIVEAQGICLSCAPPVEP